MQWQKSLSETTEHNLPSRVFPIQMDQISLEEMAQRYALTPNYFAALFKKRTGRRFVEYLTAVRLERAAELLPGHGGIVTVKGEKLGVYKDPEGALHAVDVRCPHLGCQVEWNPDERSWDCPCHGSRFDVDGKLISGPAQTDLDTDAKQSP